MRQIIISIVLLAAAHGAAAQEGYDAVLRQIEQNSTTLQALHRQMEAEMAASRTGLAPADPEVEFGYLWGSPSGTGNRTDIDVRQTFDFPSAYLHRGRIAELRDRGAEWAYKAGRAELLLAARRALVELTYYNALAAEYETRLGHAERIAATYAARLERGDATAIENNKAQLNLRSVRNARSRVEIEREALVSELARMNGGREITNYELRITNYPTETLPADFERWYAEAEERSPALQYLSTQAGIAARQVRLDRSLALPRISVGYRSERVTGERFSGVTAGISIPLWERRGRVRQARAEALAARATAADARVQYYGRLQNLHARAVRLLLDAESLRASLASYGNAELLERALAAGEISLLDYLLETEYTYTAIEDVLEAERDYRLAVAELRAAEL